MNKALLLVLMLAVVYFSNVPNLYVSDPFSWVNVPQYEQHVSLGDLLSPESIFYSPWSNVMYKEFFLHKSAHMIAYACLAFLSVRSFQKTRFRFLFLFIGVFAITDEVHQYFVIGRSGRLMDVVLDVTAAIVVLVAFKWQIRFKEKALEQSRQYAS